MPVYDYVCRNCGHIVEVIHGVNAPGPTTCTVCGGTLRKAVSAAAVVFKGSGWAKKDARTTSKPAASKDGVETAKTSGDSSPGATTESSKSTESSSQSTSSSPSSESS